MGRWSHGRDLNVVTRTETVIWSKSYRITIVTLIVTVIVTAIVTSISMQSAFLTVF
jgi:hypothetical protein